MKPKPINVLRADPDLVAGIDPSRAEEAASACTATSVRLPKGPWDPTDRHPRPDGFGLLLLSGFLVRRVGRGGRFGAELLGPGDLLRPWQTIGAVATQPFEPRWTAIATAELAVLDKHFARRASPFPTIAAQLVDRAMLRSRHLALELAIVQQPRIDRRLHMLLWQLADRWGHTTAAGVEVEVPLTHALLAELVAARRPSVTLALAKLAAEQRVERTSTGWSLRGGPPGELAEPIS